MKMYAELIWIKNIRSYDKKLNDNKLTGGDSSPNLAGLTRIFNNPLSYNVLPYKNSYSRDGKIQYTGFFIPAYEVSLDPK